jgi:hypothetical protein
VWSAVVGLSNVHEEFANLVRTAQHIGLGAAAAAAAAASAAAAAAATAAAAALCSPLASAEVPRSTPLLLTLLAGLCPSSVQPADLFTPPPSPLHTSASLPCLVQPADLEGSWKRWKEWSEHPTPELEPLPTDWKRLGGFQQLLIMRAIRPDRITLLLRTCVAAPPTPSTPPSLVSAPEPQPPAPETRHRPHTPRSDSRVGLTSEVPVSTAALHALRMPSACPSACPPHAPVSTVACPAPRPRSWVVSVLGAKYGEAINFDLPVSFEDSGPAVPIFFLLSPGVDATAEVRALGQMQDPVMDEDGGRLITVSLGQGQEPVAEKALDQMHALGGWAMLENIELVAGWLPKLEKKLEALEEGADPLFRCFMSAMPQPVVPVPILQKSIKLTNEPPTGDRRGTRTASPACMPMCHSRSPARIP